MSTVAFPLAFCTPRKQNTITCSSSSSSSSSCLPPKNTATALDSDPSIRTSLSSQVTENPNSLRRREVIIATGISAGILGTVLQPQLAAAASEAPSCEFTVSPSGLAFCDKVVGIGPQASAGQLIKAHYVGKLENGKVFDSSYGRGKPLTFRIGVGEVIKGWDQGILGTDGIPPMLPGGKRTLKIPAELGYGMRGAGCRGGTCIIPPDSVLYFDVEFIGKA